MWRRLAPLAGLMMGVSGFAGIPSPIPMSRKETPVIAQRVASILNLPGYALFWKTTQELPLGIEVHEEDYELINTLLEAGFEDVDETMVMTPGWGIASFWAWGGNKDFEERGIEGGNKEGNFCP